MIRTFLRFEVADYDQWWKVFADYEELRSAHGVTNAEVLRNVEDDKDVTVALDFATEEAAKGFRADPHLKQRMAEAGVVGAPQIWITHWGWEE